MVSTVSTTESFQFSISDYSIEHQGGAVLDVTLEYIYKPGLGNPELYFDFQQVISYIDNFFVTYPNETDYWEILNKNLSDQLATDTIDQSFGFAGVDYRLSDSLDELTTRLDVREGSGDVPYLRSTLVLNDFDNVVRERFSFVISDYEVEHQGDSTIDVILDYHYRPGSAGYLNPYFEFQQVANFVDNFFENYPNETDAWEVVHAALSEALTSQVVSKEFGFTGEDYFLPGIIDELSTTIAIQQGSGNVPYARSSSITALLSPGSALDAAVASAQQRFDQPLLDLRFFQEYQQLDAELQVAGQLQAPLQAGLYKVEDLDGRVVDPISGELLRPGDSGYVSAALSDCNRVVELDAFQSAGSTSSSIDLMIDGGSLLAPFVVNSYDQVIVPFAQANSDSDAGFLIDGLNVFALDDPSQCCNEDFVPLQLAFADLSLSAIT